jgi:flagellar biosynthesis protein FlhF
MELMEFTGSSYDEASLAMKDRLGHDAVIIKKDIQVEKKLFGLLNHRIYRIFAFKPAKKKPLKTDPLSSEKLHEKNNLKNVMDVVNKLKQRTQPAVSDIPPIVPKEETHEQDLKVLETHIDDFKLNLEQLQKLSQNIEQKNTSSSIVKQLYNELCDRDYEKTMLDEIFKEIKKSPSSMTLQQLKHTVIEKIKDTITVDSKFSFSSDKKPHFIILMGTTGEGKTSTLVKLAYKWIVSKKKKVGVINMDTSRIGATAQLETCLSMIASESNVKTESVYSPIQFQEVVDSFQDCDIVLIDTAGRNQKNKTEIEELAEINNYLKDYHYENILVMNSMKKFRDMNSIFKKFDELDISRVVFSMTDATTSYGSILSLLFHYQVPICYFTNGKSIEKNLIVPRIKNLFSEIAGITITDKRMQ